MEFLDLKFVIFSEKNPEGAKLQLQICVIFTQNSIKNIKFRRFTHQKCTFFIFLITVKAYYTQTNQKFHYLIKKQSEKPDAYSKNFSFPISQLVSLECGAYFWPECVRILKAVDALEYMQIPAKCLQNNERKRHFGPNVLERIYQLIFVLPRRLLYNANQRLTSWTLGIFGDAPCPSSSWKRWN